MSTPVTRLWHGLPSPPPVELLIEEPVALEEIAVPPSLPHRTAREAEGVLMAADGVADAVIADSLGVSRSTGSNGASTSSSTGSDTRARCARWRATKLFRALNILTGVLLYKRVHPQPGVPGVPVFSTTAWTRACTTM